MSEARLTALRLVGFKSFAERTTVEFGPGISAVVGPNGSGKSNLADALRWTLGEQGRSLRTRRSEDVIFAGSSSRRAIGMADVTLVIDNHDRLLPVDFGEVEIGRRLYRSGENEYLLNRQRVRLRDLVELLDTGNLADNAFLFIGQGMVDQALALRPEERRPLFEEAAGVRRHERRRRRAEAELAEAESNLERLRDVLAELRPQARRLAAQAEQLQARQTAGLELAEALLGTARSRWVAAAQAATRSQKEINRSHTAADAALVELHAAEALAASLTEQMGRRADVERAQREALDEHRARVTEIRVNQARLDSELGALSRDEQRLAQERTAADSRMSDARAQLNAARESVDPALATELGAVERQLAEIEAMTAPGSATGAREQLMRQLTGLRSDLGGHERRSELLGRQAAEVGLTVSRLEPRERDATAELAKAAEAVHDAAKSEQSATAELEAARSDVDSLTARRSAAHERQTVADVELAAARRALAAIESAVASSEDDGLARAARARGAQPLAEGLEIDQRFRLAVAGALGSAATAYLVDADVVPTFAARRGTLVLRAASSRGGASARDREAVLSAAGARGGGSLAQAVRRDPQGAVTRLLERVVWLPDPGAAVDMRASLPPGWAAVALDGTRVSDQGIVRLGQAEPVLDRRRELDDQQRTVVDLERRSAEDGATLSGAAKVLSVALDKMRTAQNAHGTARADVRRAEERERLAQRRAEQAVRELAWERSQTERLTGEGAATDQLMARLGDEIRGLEEQLGSTGGGEDGAALRARAAELRGRAAELRRRHDQQEAGSRSADERRRTAEVRITIDESRLRELDDESERLVGRRIELDQRRDQTDRELSVADARHEELRVALEAVLAEGADDRKRLLAAEHAAVEARERLRTAETASRQAEVGGLEARLQLEQTREQLLVELAGIGADGLTALRSAAQGDGGAAESHQSADGQAADAEAEAMEAEALEELLKQAIGRWQAEGPGEVPPTAGRLAALRRRFHDLGAGNPFAVEEYAELRERLESLEAQRADMESAIASTRELIASLGQMINDQFRTTFAALEGAFARRFTELFGGGDAQLSLTAPDDLSATGVEIHARPPGKKRQPLSMLSGGERALTAVSLLLAMLEVRPVPFCVLDEVDAALDEANVGRFSKALRGLSENTQFIVITHNRGTIEAADALYGVTLGDDAVSRVVSLRLPRNGHHADGAEAVAEVSPR
ncbi:chromosome segregation protein SMC [soil metagenome]